jgi:hypothetical protein
MRRYFYDLLHRHLSVFVAEDDRIVEVEPVTLDLVSRFPRGTAVAREGKARAGVTSEPLEALRGVPPDWILLGGSLHYELDIERLLRDVRALCVPGTRLVVTYYSSLWKPLFRIASWLGVRGRLPESNWLAHEDIANLLRLAGFEPVHLQGAVLLPIPIPLLSRVVNRYLAQVPGLRSLDVVNILVARPLEIEPSIAAPPSVSIVVPARNEAGNIDAIVRRTPAMGPDDELIFVEGHSTDGTWEAIVRAQEAHGGTRRIVAARQDGKGKGDAVRMGFSLARNDVFMILDADMTVPPEDLPRFYRAIRSGAGELVNGSRLVYPMEGRAMRFLNLVANRFFAYAFSFVLGQRVKDTLCGTKVLSRASYEKIQDRRSFFGYLDPFGDFDLLFGAARLRLKIVEVPIRYRERTYGQTNISRWTHGALLLRMLQLAARKLKFV